MKMGIPFESEEAKKLNIGIFQCIYYNSLRMSCVLSKEHGHYGTFHGSPTSKGILQFDMLVPHARARRARTNFIFFMLRRACARTRRARAYRTNFTFPARCTNGSDFAK